MKPEQTYIDLYKQYQAMLAQHAPGLMNRWRDKALQDFERLGFPSTSEENYLYSDISGKFAEEYGMNLRRLDFPINPYEVFRCDVPNLSTLLYFMVNDTFYAKQLRAISLPKGVFIGSIADFAMEYPEIAEKHYEVLAKTSNDGTTAFNTLFVQDAFVLYVPEDVVLDKAIQLVNILRSDVDLLVNRRFLVILEDRAEAKLLLCDHGMDRVKFLATQVTEVYLGKNALFDLYELEENTPRTTRLSSIYVDQQDSSRFSHNVITLNNGFTRNNLYISLKGERAEALAGGVAIADTEQHIDNFTWVNHEKANCHSNELYKYILDDKATGVFNGRIIVHPGAQKTEAYQTNRNLCLTKEAKMYSKPQLEIYADDVKCSHGLTTGQIDENALFYLRSRGISKEEALLLLKFAFTSDVLDRIHLEPLRDRLRLLIEKRLRDELSKCERCSVCNDN
ncbi:MAG: Fe-S cluster assembly protein SufD [Bacteroidales bacterium]|nr:Fe-S cluster assembly protein SufD [Bacteroidales bacterium]